VRFQFTEEQARFRQELSDFLDQEVLPHMQTVFGAWSKEQYQFGRQLYKKMAQRHWPTIGWPVEYGGGGKTFVEQSIFDEQIGYHRVPRVCITSLNFAGPALMRFGSEEQKINYLRPIASTDVDYCQGFSEPDAGSDLASLQMRAEKDGDDYILNGSKIFTSYYLHADYIYLLARTNQDLPKHKGISLYIVDCKTPGITFQDLPFINGEFAAQTFFDNVRAPHFCLIGEENQGWYYAMTTLDYERAGLERYARTRRTFDDFVELCKNTRDNGKPLSEDAIVRHKLAESKMNFETWKWLCWKVAWMQSQGLVPNAEASIAFLHGTDVRFKFAQAAMEILGFYGSLTPECDLAPLQGAIEGLSRESLHLHGAGTMEIHRNIIAQRGLGLPR